MKQRMSTRAKRQIIYFNFLDNESIYYGITREKVL